MTETILNGRKPGRSEDKTMINGTPELRNCDTHALCVSAKKTQPQAFVQRWQQRVNRWQINWRTRRQLAQLDSHQLKDIGVSRGEAQQEADKPFWRD